MNEKDGDNRIEDHDDLLAVVGLVRSVPRMRPGLRSRSRIWFYTRFPSLIRDRNEATRREGAAAHQVGWVHGAFRVAAAVCVTLAAVIITFGGLTVAARNAKPGDPLYSLKRARENLEMAFTFNDSGKAEKNLALAEVRLEELDDLLAVDRADSARVEQAVSDYNARTRAVSEVLSTGDVEDAQSLASRLREVKTEEKSIERKLAAAGISGNPVPVANADVIIDYTGDGAPLGSGKSRVTGRTDSGGRISFTADLEDRSDASLLQAKVLADGCEAVLPVYSPVNASNVACTVVPDEACLRLGDAQSFDAALDSRRGARTVQLTDATATSTINGSTGAVSLTTDSAGRFSFTVVKTSAACASRIELKVLEGTWRDAGEILAVGGMKSYPGGDTRGVTSSVRGASVVLDNGIVEVVADGADSGIVVRSITGHGTAGKAGPLGDPEISTLAQRGDRSFEHEGPTLTASTADSATYRVSYVIRDAAGLERRVYDVTLERGKSFARVSCGIQCGSRSSTQMEVARLAIPAGAGIEVSGEKVGANTGPEPVYLPFNIGEPFVEFSAGGASGFFSCPIASATYPDAWKLGRDYVGVQVKESSDSSTTLMLGVAGQAGLQVMEKQSVEGNGDGVTRNATRRDAGFTLDASPARPSAGRQRVTLTIYRQDSSPFDN